MNGRLQGIRIVDFTAMIEGWMVTQIFAEHGEDVMRELGPHADEIRVLQRDGILA